MSQNGFIFPKDRGENKKIFELPPPSNIAAWNIPMLGKTSTQSASIFQQAYVSWNVRVSEFTSPEIERISMPKSNDSF